MWLKRMKLGFLTIHGDTENHSLMMSGVFDVAKKNDVDVIRFATKIFDEDLDTYNEELNNLYKIIEAQNLDGLMFLGWMPGLVGEYFDHFKKRFSHIPIVSLGTSYENIPNVYADNKDSIKELIHHLVTVHGHRRIVFVPPALPDIRIHTYEEEMCKYGFYDPELILDHDELAEVPFEFRMQRALSILLDEKKQKPEAILVMYDAEAQYALKEFRERKIKVPEDIAIASFENTEYSKYSNPPLTAITFPWREIGYQGCEKLIKIIRREPVVNTTAIPCRLILRKTCGCTSNRTKIIGVKRGIQPNSAQVSRKEKDNWVMESNQAHMKKLDQDLHYFSQKLIDTFNVEELLSVLEKHLKRLDIPSCYIYQFLDNSYQACRMIFQYVNKNRMEIDSTKSDIYISDEIVQNHKKLTCQLLFVNSDYLGFIVFEPSLMDERVYHTLSLHVSSALKSSILFEKLQHEIKLRKEKEYQLIYMANYDSLTDLFNRRFFYLIANSLIESKNLYITSGFYLIYMDVDGFKQVNDSLGHGFGDYLLIEIAKRLQSVLKSYTCPITEIVDSSIAKLSNEAIFRVGGDEFTAIISKIDIEDMKHLAQSLVDTIKQPYFINGHTICISCSVGISIYPEDEELTEMIIKYADMAMYHSKKQKNRYSFYHEITKE